MAHQVHNICWSLLASNLEFYSPDIPTNEQPANLYFRFDPHQEQDIAQFISFFIYNIQQCTEVERAKYPAVYGTPDPDDILLDSATVRKIAPAVSKWRYIHVFGSMGHLGYSPFWKHSVRKLCSHDNGFECGCAIPFQERKASSFLRPCRKGDEDRTDYRQFYHDQIADAEAFYSVELVKTLLLCGEMDPILRLCSHPEVHFWAWQSKRLVPGLDRNFGWDIIYKRALDAYIGLNILYCFPTLWIPASGKDPDYRSTKIYQRMLKSCTCSDASGSDVSRFPHRAFFGILHTQFQYYAQIRPEIETKHPEAFLNKKTSFLGFHDFPYGQIPIEDLLNSEVLVTGLMPSADEVELVKMMLRFKGLPEELVLDVIELADYTVKRTLERPHDPLHPDNQAHLQHYLDYCWLLLVNCNMMANSLNVSIDWEALLQEFFAKYMSIPNERKIF